MQNRVRAIITNDRSLLTIKRVKAGEAYWVFPGGGVEDGENHQQVLIRECKEELGVNVLIGRFLFENTFMQDKDGPQKEFFYECEISGGKLGSGDGPEFDPNSHYEGTRELQWINIENLNSTLNQ